MLHKQRVWYVVPAESVEMLAEQLTQYTRCGCNAFQLGGYLFVNDATSSNGAQEFGVLRPQEQHYVQIESITFGWMTTARALELVRQVLAGQFDGEQYDVIDRWQIQTPAQHGRCALCA